MTTITIKKEAKIFRKTNFDSAEKLFDYLLEHLFLDDNLPELTKKELIEAEKAKKEWQQNPSKFSKVLK